MEKTLEELYGVKSREVDLTRIETESGKWLELFSSPGPVLVSMDFPEFTCRCPRTSHPDFANIRVVYVPQDVCVELKSWKYYLNSFRDEGHFHEAVVWLISQDFVKATNPLAFHIAGEFNVRGGVETLAECTYRKDEGWVRELS
ncbi:preQ(1) synthase [Patescibacteria group bacterium]|nr:preQ(1) synthase [Patescibacteria group bacterium]